MSSNGALVWHLSRRWWLPWRGRSKPSPLVCSSMVHVLSQFSANVLFDPSWITLWLMSPIVQQCEIISASHGSDQSATLTTQSGIVKFIQEYSTLGSWQHALVHKQLVFLEVLPLQIYLKPTAQIQLQIYIYIDICTPVQAYKCKYI